MKTEINIQDNIRFAIPINLEKGKNAKGEEVYKFQGLASTTSKDSQGEELLAKQFDLSNFKQVNWNHAAKNDANAVLGEVESHFFDKKGLNVRGELYSEMPMTGGVVNLMKALKKRGKHLELSVEGQVLERGSKDKSHPAYNKIVKAKLTGVAITPNAINSDTFCELMEKGYTNNDWQYDSETEQLVKSMEAGSITGTETTNRTLTAEPLKQEDLEGSKNKKHDKSTCKIKDCTACGDKKLLSKSFAYEKIFTYFYNVDIEKAKQIYKLADKISNMAKTVISEETLKKAFEIIELASSEVENEKQLEKSVDSAVILIRTEDFDDLEKSEVVSKLEKAGFEKKVAEEAAEKESPRKSKKKKEHKKDEDEEDHKKDKKEKDDMKDEDEKKDIKKSVEALAIKTDEFQNNSDLKLGAIGVILKSQSETIEELMALNKSLTETIAVIATNVDKISKTPITKNRVGAEVIERFEKSEDGFNTFNLKNKVQRKALSDKLEHLSGFDKANQNGGKYDEQLFKAAQDIELLHVIGDARTLTYLRDVHKINVVNGVE